MQNELTVELGIWPTGNSPSSLASCSPAMDPPDQPPAPCGWRAEAGGFGRLWMCIWPEHRLVPKLGAGILAEVERMQMKGATRKPQKNQNASAIQWIIRSQNSSVGFNFGLVYRGLRRGSRLSGNEIQGVELTFPHMASSHPCQATKGDLCMATSATAEQCKFRITAFLLTSQHLTSPSLLIRTDYFEFLGIQSGWWTWPRSYFLTHIQHKPFKTTHRQFLALLWPTC
jgi:hypothetical protein